MPLSEEAILICSVCCRERSADQLLQTLPCLHVFCLECIDRQKRISKESGSQESDNPDDTQVDESNRKQIYCLAPNCFSKVREAGEGKLDLNRCENEDCPRKLSFVILERLNCQHEVCTTCIEAARLCTPPVCPVQGCNELLTDDEAEVCDGGCKRAFTDDNYVTTKCCGAHICFSCFEKIFSRKPINKDEEVKCPESCLLKKRRSAHKKSEPIAKCKGRDDCTGSALNGFPSRGECEHDICLNCLEHMIDECQKTGTMPRCPNEVCNTFYSVDSVIALRALLPQKASYFNDLELKNQGYDAIKDETPTLIEFLPNFKSSERFIEIKVKMSEEDTLSTVPFDIKGSVSDFIREIRRELKIQQLDKVYGFYIQRSPPEEGEETKPHEEIAVDSTAVGRSFSELKITPECLIIVDTTGIVQAKSAVIS